VVVPRVVGLLQRSSEPIGFSSLGSLLAPILLAADQIFTEEVRIDRKPKPGPGGHREQSFSYLGRLIGCHSLYVVVGAPECALGTVKVLDRSAEVCICVRKNKRADVMQRDRRTRQGGIVSDFPGSGNAARKRQ